METEHLPDLLHSVAEDLREHCSCLHPPELKSALVLCSRLLSKVQPSLQPGGSEAVPGTTSRSSQPDTCLEQAVPPGGADDLCSATMMANCVASFQRLFLRFVELWVLVQPQETLALFGSALLRKRTMQGGLWDCADGFGRGGWMTPLPHAIGQLDYSSVGTRCKTESSPEQFVHCYMDNYVMFKHSQTCGNQTLI